MLCLTETLMEKAAFRASEPECGARTERIDQPVSSQVTQ